MIGLVGTLLCAVAGGLVGMIVGAIRDDDKDTEDRIKQAAWSRAMADDMVSSRIRERAALERLATHVHGPLDDRGHYQAGVGYPCACGVMVEKLGDHFHPLSRG